MMSRTIKQVCGIALVVLATGFVTVMEHASVEVQAAQARRTSQLKGVIKSVGDDAVVVVPNENKKAEITFKVTAETARTGSLEAGNPVTVNYYFEKTDRVATALTGTAK
jgi:hypothetical protein